MDYLTTKKFSFISSALAPDAFGVVHFKGSEGISRPYEFEVMLVSNDLEIDLGAVIQNPARLIIHREEGDDVVYWGILAHFEQLHEVGGFGFYRAYLAPKLWWLSLTHHNQVILNKSLPDFVTDILKDGGLTTLDFEFRLQGTYLPVDYVCQYGESHLNFVSRWLEREGVYYFFEQTPNGEKVIFTDTAIAHVDLPQGKTIYYSPPSGLDAGRRAEVVKSFNCRRKMVPGSVFLKDYNYLKPSLEVTGNAAVDPNGRGQVYYYSEHFQTKEDGDRLAKVRAEGILCRREEFRGEGSVPYMVPGFTFDLQDHYRKSFDRKYLTTEVDHEGNQTGYLISGIQEGLTERESQVYYRNYFTAILSDVQFRPEVETGKPRVAGTIVAKIDAAGSGKYAELDEHGRYKIVLPFDLTGRKDGKASAWVRMAQPYAGSDHGMHFPLHKDTEVLLTFIDGDPDRPIIASAVPNPETPSPVKDSNQTMSEITTSGGNKIHIEDQEGSERILLHSPGANTFVRLGAPNDPPSENDDYTKTGGESFKETGYLVSTEGPFELRIGGIKLELILGGADFSIAGVANRFEFTGGAKEDILLGGKVDIHVPTKWEYSHSKADVDFEEFKASNNTVIATLATRTDLTDVTTRVTNTETSIHNTETAVRNLTTDLTNAQTNLHNEVVEAKNQVTQAVNNKMHAAATALRSVGTTLQTTGVQLGEAGTYIENHGAKIQTAGTHIKSAGSSIASSSIAIRDAAAILDA